MADSKKLKQIACDVIDKSAGELNALSQDIWDHPELMFEERHAHNVLTTFLENHGFKVQKNYILETGFRGMHGSEGKGPHVSVLSEYDALPGIGHACGHNLIAEVGVGAGLGIKAALDASKESGQELGQISVIGCPAEEGGGGGKIDLLAGKAFDSVDISMMCHPYPIDWAVPLKFALEILNVKYTGKASHAAGFPWEGINALDAAVMAYTNVSVMRQQMKPNWRIHGIITNGGAKPNIIPEETEMEYYVRAPTIKELEVLKVKATKCFEAAATATGCKVQLQWHPKPYYNVITNKHLASLFEGNATNIGVNFCKDARTSTASGSTDMGNVSQVVPSIHPMFYIGSDAVNHTRDFTTASGDPKAQAYTLKQAKALAMTAIDVMCDPKNLAIIKEGFKADLEQQKA